MSFDNASSPLHVCANCANEHLGMYCNRCGEKVLIPREKTLLYFLQQLVSAMTFADTKLLRSLRMIVGTPGKYSVAIAEGKRVQLMRSINLFLLCNLIYFFFPVLDTFNTSLQTQMSGLPSSSIFKVEERVKAQIAEQGLSIEEFKIVYNERSSSNSKLLLILLVIFFSFGFSLLGFNRRSFFVDHLTFAFEYGIFVLFINTIVFGYLIYGSIFLLQHLSGPSVQISELYLSLVVTASSLYFLVRGIKTYYAFKWPISVLLSVLAFAWSFASLQTYRWVLFEFTFASL